MSKRFCGTCREEIPEGGREEAGLWFHDTWEDCQAAMSGTTELSDAFKAYRRRKLKGRTLPHPTLDQTEGNE